MSKRNLTKCSYRVEVLEPRLLLAADWLAGLAPAWTNAGEIEGHHIEPGEFLPAPEALDAGFYARIALPGPLDLGDLQVLHNSEDGVGEPALPGAPVDVVNPMRHELVIIDAGVQGYEELVTDFNSRSDGDTHYDVHVLEVDADGVLALTAILAGYSDLDALHIVSHGDNGGIALGDTQLDAANIDVYTQAVRDWSAALDTDADLLIYGCNLAGSVAGQTLVGTLGALTGADVAASSDATGQEGRGGDWDLEYRLGDINSSVAFSAQVQSEWGGLLALFSVNTLDDTIDINPGDGIALDASGNTSLRAAIMEANVLPGADTIMLPAGVYDLTIAGFDEDAGATGDLDIRQDLTIVGAGAGATVIDAQGLDRVIEIRSVSAPVVTISGVTIQGGDTTAALSSIGGGIRVLNGASLTLTDSVVTDNKAFGLSGHGGGVASGGNLQLVNVELSENTAQFRGGGLFQGSGPLAVSFTNVTISGNSADEGGGFYNQGTPTLTNVTIADNTADTRGGGISVLSTSPILTNSLVANNTAPLGPDIDGVVTSTGDNLVFDPVGATGLQGSDITLVDPNLGVLSDNGGGTRTHALIPVSPAIDAASVGPAPANDQRGVTRDGSPDIGAFEYNPNSPPIAIDDSYDVAVNTTLFVNAAAGLLANDTDIDFDPLRLYLISEPPNGTLTLNPVGLADVENLTMDAGLDASPDWSPDSNKIAFSSFRGGEYEIYTINADGTGLTQLTSNTDTELQPVWSPDGTQILYRSNAAGTFDIYVMDADGSNPVRLTTGVASDGADEFDARWSPDGSQIVYVLDLGNPHIYVMDSDGSNATPLTTPAARDTAPAWSPDGLSIVFASDRDGNSVIFVMDADGSNVTSLTTNTALDDAPTWSPDGSKILFHSDRNGDFEIFVMDADGSDVLQITDNTDVDTRAVWSPDGMRIAFQTDRDGNNEIYVSTILSDGGFTYTPRNGFAGIDTFTYQVTDGIHKSAPATVTLSVGNIAPTATNLSQSFGYVEDGGSVALDDIVVTDADVGETITATLTLADVASGVLSDSSGNGETYTAGTGVWTVTGSVAQVNAALAAIKFAPTADGNVNTTISTHIEDLLGTGPADGLITLTGTAVNDMPSFSTTGDQNVLEDSGPHTVAGFATALPGGGTDEAGQMFSYTIGSDNPGLFLVGPAIDASGTLTYTLNPNLNGTATVTVSVTDDGGTANGGVDTSADQTFDIIVGAVNDVPSFSTLGDQNVLEDSGPHTVVGFATALPGGGVDEAGQLFSYTIGSDNPGLFLVGPAIDASGTLTYTLNPNLNGTATVTVSVTDDGGTANGGVDTSADQTFDIIVGAVNDDPTAVAGGTYVINEGDPLLLDGSGSSDSDGTVVQYLWDLNNDLVFGDVTTDSPTVSWMDLSTLWDIDDGDVGGTNYTIGLRVVDDLGATHDTTATVTVNNVAPTLVATGAGAATSGVTYTLNLSATDPGDDLITEWTINWGDGTTGVYAGNPGSVSHTYLENGLYDILVSATDADGTHHNSQVVVPSQDNDDLNFYDADGTLLHTETGGSLDGPENVVLGPDGLLYVSSFHDGTIKRYNTDGTYADGASPYFYDTGSSSGTEIVFDEDGYLYAANYTDNAVYRIDGTGSGVLFLSAADGLDGPGGLDFGPDGNLYVANWNNDRVLRFNGSTGAFVDEFVSFREGGVQNPVYITFTNTDQLFVAGQTSNAIHMYDSNGAHIGNITHATLSAGQTRGIEVGPDGKLYVSVGDTSPMPNSSSVQIFDPLTGAHLGEFLANPAANIDYPGSIFFTPALQVTVTAAANIAPTFSSFSGAVDTANEDDYTEVSFADLIAQGDENDVDGTVDAFVVQGVSSGTLRIGATEAGSTVWAAGSNDTIDAGNNAYWTPDPDATGTQNAFEVVAMDDGGLESITNVMAPVNVTPVNDAPLFSTLGDQNVLEDSGPHTVVGFATALPGGGVDEAGQLFSYTIGSDNPGLFLVGPAIDASGTLTYTLNPNLNGTATVTVSVTDDGGTANGGVDTSADQTFDIVVGAVNDVPSFSTLGDQNVLEDSGPHTVVGFATALPGGGIDESGQTFSYIVSSDNPGLFLVGPSIDAAGTLMYTLNANVNGSATVTVSVTDSGGTTNGGVDTSADQMFDITIDPVNDAPTFSTLGDQYVLENSGVHTIAGFSMGSPGGGPDEAGQSLDYTVASNNLALFDDGPDIDASGTLTFTLNPNVSGVARISVYVADSGNTANGGVDTSAVQFFDIIVGNVDDSPTVLLATDGNVASDDVPGLDSWQDGMVIGFGDPGFALGTGAATSGAFTLVFDLDTFGSDRDLVGLHFVTSNLIVGSGGGSTEFALQPGDLLLAIDGGSATFTGLTTLINVQDSDVFVFRPQTTGDYSNGEFYFLIDNALGDVVHGIALVESSAVSIGDGPALMQGTFLFSQNGSGLSDNIYTYVAQTIGDGTTTSVAGKEILVDGEDSGDLTYSDEIQGIHLIEEDTTIGGVSFLAGDLLLTLDKDIDSPAGVGTTNLAVSENDIFRLRLSETQQGPNGHSIGEATIVFDGSNVGLDSSSADVNALTLIRPPPNSAPTATNLNQTQPYFEDSTSVALSDIIVTDADAGDTITATLTLADTAAGVLSTASGNGESYNAVSGVWSITGTVIQVNAALSDVAFLPVTNSAVSTTISTHIEDLKGSGPADGLIALNGTPVNDAPSFSTLGDQNVLEDSGPHTVVGFATALPGGGVDESGQTFSYAISSGNPGLFLVGPAIDASGTLTYTLNPNLNGSATVTVSVTDSGGTANGGVDTSADQTFDINVGAVNDNPTADATSGQPYVISEGGSVTFDASNSSDIDGTIVSYEWDLDNDTNFGEPGESTGVNPLVSWFTLQSFGIDDDGAPYTIGLRVTDDLGQSHTVTTTLTVNNTAPTLATTGAATINDGGLYTLNLGSSDPGDDTITSWTISWGDGTVETVAGNPSSTTHTYSGEGFTFNILASATDEDGTFLQNELLVTSYDLNDSVFRYAETTGNFLQQFATTDGLNDPIEVIIGPDGNLYVTGEASDNVLRYNAVTGAFIDEFVSASDGGLDSPAGLAFGPDGNLYVSSYATDEVLRYNGTTGAFIDAFVSAGSGGLKDAYGLTFGPDGNLYVNSFGDNNVLRYDGSTGAFIDTFVSASSGGLSTPEQMVFGPDGNLYIASFDTNEVLRYDGISGAFLDAFITAGSGGLDQTTGLVFGPDGNLYVGDYRDAVILRYDGISGAFIDEYVAAGSGGLISPDFINFLPEQQVTVTVANNAPTLTLLTSPVDTTTEDTAVEISFVDLTMAGNENDVDGMVDAFVVKGVTTGILRIGNSAGTATAWVAGSNDTIDAGNNAYWTPDPDTNGMQSAFEVVARDDDGMESAVNVTAQVSVATSNDAPSFSTLGDQNVLEDSGPHAVAGFATALSGGGADESGQTFSYAISSDNPGLFLVGPAIDASGTLTYTLNPNLNGSATVTVSVTDSGGTANGGVDTSADQTFDIIVGAVNDAPSFSTLGDQNVLEDSGPHAVAGFATALSGGGADESGQTFSYAISSDNPGLFLVGPAIDASGTLTYTLNPNLNGSATVTVSVTDSGGTANGGVDTSADQTIEIIVGAVNDAPLFSTLGDQNVLEDSGPHTVAGFATALPGGGVDESGQTFSYAISSDNPGLFLVGPAIDASGTLTYTLNPNLNGSATVTVSVTDSGGTANGGVDTSADQTFEIIVGAVNDAPLFSTLGDQNVLEDSGPHTVAGFATALPGGGVDESGQTFSYAISSDNPGLFLVGPAIDASGTLTYTLNPNLNGTATVTVSVTDSGGTANGGVDTSADQTFEIIVGAVNDAPLFSTLGDQNVLEDSGPHTVAGFVTALPGGGVDESGQTFSYAISSDNPGLFLVGPAIDASGTLTYTLNPNLNGTATVTVSVTDSGGTANGGVDTSADQTFEIIVSAVNDVPSFSTLGDQRVLEDSGPHTVVGFATGFPGGGTDESGQTFSFTVGTANPGLFLVGPAIDAAGTLTYTLNPNLNGTATVTVSVTDTGGTANGGVDTSADQTFEIIVGAVNDAPSFSTLGDQSVLEDSGPHTVAGFATALPGGGTDESGQTFNYTISSDNPGLFLVGPAIDASGTLTYALNSSIGGTATVTVSVTDSGGTMNGGVDASADQTFDIVVVTVDSIPTATNLNQTHYYLEDAAMVTLNDITVTDSDVGDLLTATLKLSDLSAGSLTAGSGNGETYTVATGIWTVTGSVAQVNAALSAVAFVPVTDNVVNVSIHTHIEDMGGQGPSDGVIAINVAAVNDVPSFSMLGDQNVLEDSGPHTVVGFAMALPGGGVDESGQTFSYTISSDNPSLFLVGPAIDSAGTLTYTLNANLNGTATVTVSVSDSGGTANGGVDTSADQTFNIIVGAVNDVPSFSVLGDQTVNEDSGPHTVVGFATALPGGGVDESGQTVSYSISSDNPGLFLVGPAIDAAGTLTYTLNANVNGSATVTVSMSDSGGTVNGGVDASAAQAFDIVVALVNDTPLFSTLGDQRVVEDSGPHTVVGFATALPGGGVDESGQAFGYTLSSDNPGLFLVGPAIDASGILTYTLNPNLNGTATVTVSVTDSGGTANGGVDTSADQAFNIIVGAVNDAPLFSTLGDQTVNQDSGPHTVLGFATAVPGGGVDETSQALGYAISSDNPGLFLVGPVIDASGTLTYTLNANINGTATVTMSVSDSGGTVNGGVDTSPGQVFEIVVVKVDSVPTAANLDQVHFYLEDAALVALDNIIVVDNDIGDVITATLTLSDISAGSLTAGSGNGEFYAVATGIWTVTGSVAQVNAALTAVTFVPAADNVSNASIHTHIEDQGGQGPPDGVIAVNVAAVNDVPSFSMLGDQNVLEDSGPHTLVGFATALPGGGMDESGQTFSYTISNDNPSLFLVGPAIDPSGTMTYTLNANLNGTATVTVSVTDSGGTPNDGVDTSADQTFNIIVGAVNDVPSFSVLGDQAVNEDSGPHAVVGFATALPGGGVDESGQTFVYAVSSDNVGLFLVAPAIDALGMLTYTLDSNVNGSATVTVSVTDSGGTTNGGIDTSADQTFNIIVGAVNDVPSFSVLGDQAVNEDSGPHAVVGFATALPGGGVDESGQTFVYAVSSDNVGLFLVAPAIDASGMLTYTLNSNVNGSATVTVSVTDSGGTTNSGIDTSTNQTFDIIVGAVNDAPTFSTLGDQNVQEDTGSHTVVGFATALPGGGVDESGQTFSYTLSSDNPGLFLVGPAIDASGTLTYSLNTSVSGSATITVSVTDSGGTINDGVQTSADQVFDIVVVPVDSVPIATNLDQVQLYLEDSGPVELHDIVVDVGGTGGLVSATLTLADITAGSLSAVSGNGEIYTATTGVWTIAGTVAQVNAALADVTFIPVADNDVGTTLFTQIEAAGGQSTAAGLITLGVTPVNDAPVGTDRILTVASGSIYAFTIADFGFADPVEGDAAIGVEIVSPPAWPGMLINNGVFVSAGDVISAEDIDAGRLQLISIDAQNPDARATLVFRVQDDGGTAAGGINFDPVAKFLTILMKPTLASDFAATAVATDGLTVGVAQNDLVESNIESTPDQLPPLASDTPPLSSPVAERTAPVPVVTEASFDAGVIVNDTGISLFHSISDVSLDAVSKVAVTGPANQTAPLPGAGAQEHLLTTSPDDIELGLNGMRTVVAQDIANDQFALGRSAATVLGLSVGYMSWLLRGGVLLSSVLSSFPVWRFVDPLPVFARERDRRSEDGDDESLEAIVQSRRTKSASAKQSSKPPPSSDRAT